jgi:uncharacterized membrane protein HdeD (DUF308 family)
MKNIDKEYLLNIISRILLFFAGIFCIIRQENILTILPYFIGFVMIASGIILFVDSIIYYKDKNFSKENELLPDSYDSLHVRAFAFLIIGIIIIVSRNNAFSIIGISWGIFGIIKGGRNFSYFLYCFFLKKLNIIDDKWKVNLIRKRMISYMITCIVELTLGIILLMEPVTKLGTHITILGFRIVIYSILGIDIISKKSDNIKKHILNR